MIAIAPARQAHWDRRAAGNFVCGGTGCGLLAFAAAAAWTGMAGFEWAALAGVVFIASGLLLVWHEIGRPIRFLNVLRNPRTSWMSREAWAAAVLMPAAALGVLFASAGLVVLAAAAGLVFLVSQAQMLRAARGVPAWRDPAIVPVIVTTGLAEGFGLALAASSAGGQPPAWLAVSAVALVAAGSLAVLVYALRLRDGRAPLEILPELGRASVLAIGAGGVAPAALIAVAHAYDAPSASLAAGLAIAAAGWRFKYTIVRALSFTQGFAVQHAPARGTRWGGPGARPGWL